MLSSHILPELADICNKIGIIERGKLIFNGTVDEAMRAVRQGYVFLVSVGADRNEAAARRLETYAEVATVRLEPGGGSIRVALKDGFDDGSFIPERLIAERFRLQTFQEEKIDIEDVYMRITKGITN